MRERAEGEDGERVGVIYSDADRGGSPAGPSISSPPPFTKWNQNTEWLKFGISNGQQLQHVDAPSRLIDDPQLPLISSRTASKCFGQPPPFPVSSTAPEPSLTASPITLRSPTASNETRGVPSPSTQTSATPVLATSSTFGT